MSLVFHEWMISIREGAYELDPTDNGNWLSLGALDIVFRTDNYGPPNVGIVLTDPLGRRIGFDPLTRKAWQGLPAREVTSIAMIWIVELLVVGSLAHPRSVPGSARFLANNFQELVDRARAHGQ